MKYCKDLTITFPVFERKDFFKDALLSVINQTVKCDIIVVDNCSSHFYFKDVCEELNVNYVRNSENIGLFPNWNKCISLVETKYAMIFQDDNIMLPTFVEEFLNIITVYPDLDLYFTNFESLDLATKGVKNHSHVFPYGFMANGEKVLEFGIKEKLGFPYAFIINKKYFTKYYYECHGSNDWLWVYQNIQHLSVFGNEKILFQYGSHPEQDSKNADTHMKCMLSIAYIYKKVLKEKVNNDSLKDLSHKRFLSVFFYFLAIGSDEFITSLTENNHIYAKFFRDEMESSFIFSNFTRLPFPIRNISYRVLRKIFSLSI
jgi:hypothetical protein